MALSIAEQMAAQQKRNATLAQGIASTSSAGGYGEPTKQAQPTSSAQTRSLYNEPSQGTAPTSIATAGGYKEPIASTPAPNNTMTPAMIEQQKKNEAAYNSLKAGQNHDYSLSPSAGGYNEAHLNTPTPPQTQTTAPVTPNYTQTPPSPYGTTPTVPTQQPQQPQNGGFIQGTDQQPAYNQYGATPVPPLDATGQSNIGMASSLYQDTLQQANELKQAQDAARKNGIINTLMQTNITDLGYTRDQLSKMSLDQLESIQGTPGLDLASTIKSKLTANDEILKNQESLARDTELADIEMTKRQLERNLGRAVTEREQVNAEQDARLRKILGLYGGGQSDTFQGNMAVMDATEKGQRALEDIRADFADRNDALSRQYTLVDQTHNNNIKIIQNNMTAKVENAFADLTSKLDGYIAQGVTDKKDLMNLILPAKKDFVMTYMKETTDAAARIRQQNEDTFNQMIKLQEEARAQDKDLSASYGVIFKDGQPVVDQQGNQIPTFDNMKFLSEQDQRMTENSGIVYRNGTPLLDSKGNNIPTFNAKKFQAEQYQANRTYNRDIDKDTADLLDKGISTGIVDPQTGMIVGSSGIFSANGSQYNPLVRGDQVQLDLPRDDAGTPQLWNKLREQCGEFVNDIFGKKIMPDSFAGKMQAVRRLLPVLGSAFVQNTNNQYGHTGFVNSVQTNANGVPISMKITDSNYKSAGKVDEATIDIRYDGAGNPSYYRNGKKVDIRGFTNSILGTTSATPSAQISTSPSGTTFIKTGNNQSGKILPTTTITMLSDAKAFPTILNNLEKTINSSGASFGPIWGSARSFIPWDTSQQVAGAELRTAAQMIGKFMEGGVLRKEDEIKYQKMLPQTSDTKEVALGKLRQIRTMLSNKEQQYKTDLAASGYAVPSTGAINIGGGNTVTMIDNDGNQVEVDSDQIQEAQNLGLHL